MAKCKALSGSAVKGLRRPWSLWLSNARTWRAQRPVSSAHRLTDSNRQTELGNPIIIPRCREQYVGWNEGPAPCCWRHVDSFNPLKGSNIHTSFISMPPLSSARQHLSYGDCLEFKKEYYQNSSVLDCVTKFSQSAAHLYEQFLQVQEIGFVTMGPFCCA